MSASGRNPSIADFILGCLDEKGNLSERYRKDPSAAIRNSNLNQHQKDVLLSRDQDRIRKEMEAESGRELSKAAVTIVLGMPTIILS